MKKLFNNLLALTMLGVAVFVFRGQLANIYNQLAQKYFPCRQPIYYSIGTFDARFGLSREDFLSAVKTAEGIWEKAAGKNLFDYSANGALKINLVFDKRQQTTNALQTIGTAVDKSKASYDALRLQFETAKTALDSDQNLYDSKKAAIENELNDYNAKVESWNARGGAPRSVYAELSAEKDTISADIATLDNLRQQINTEVANVNSLVTELNSLAQALNLNVASYNTVGGSLSGKFEEGLYKSDSGGQEIDIYQFDDQDKLVRVLAHELGHALGLEHVTDPNAIMYYLNESGNEKPSSADLAELKALCGIK